YGLAGAAIGTLIGSTISCITAYIKVRSMFDISLPADSMGRVLLASGVIALFSFLVRVPSKLIILWYVLMMGVYLLILSVTREFNASDRQQLAEILPAAIGKRIQR